MSDELINKILIEVIDMKSYLRGHVVTKEEFQKKTDEIAGQIDGFVKLHETLDLELVSLRSKVERLEGRIEKVETKLGLAGA